MPAFGGIEEAIRSVPLDEGCSPRCRAIWTRCSASLDWASRCERRRSASFSGAMGAPGFEARGAIGAGFTAADRGPAPAGRF